MSGNFKSFRGLALIFVILALAAALLLKRTARDIVNAGQKKISRTLEQTLREKLPRRLQFASVELNRDSLVLDSVSYAGAGNVSRLTLVADWTGLLTRKTPGMFNCQLRDFRWTKVFFPSITLSATLADSSAIRLVAVCPCTGSYAGARFIFDTLSVRVRTDAGRLSSGEGLFRARAYHGRVAGEGSFASPGKGIRYNLDVTLKDVDINALPQKPEGISFEGRYNGKLSFSGDAPDLDSLNRRLSP